MDNWPFSESQDFVTIAVKQIISGAQPILLVSHDAEEGDWMFLTGGNFDMDDSMMVSLKQIVSLDTSVLELADLPVGWEATRESISKPWQRSVSESA